MEPRVNVWYCINAFFLLGFLRTAVLEWSMLHWNDMLI